MFRFWILCLNRISRESIHKIVENKYSFGRFQQISELDGYVDNSNSNSKVSKWERVSIIYRAITMKVKRCWMRLWFTTTNQSLSRHPCSGIIKNNRLQHVQSHSCIVNNVRCNHHRPPSLHSTCSKYSNVATIMPLLCKLHIIVWNWILNIMYISDFLNLKNWNKMAVCPLYTERPS